MSSHHQWEDYLEDILDAVEAIEEFILDIKYEEFLRDRKTSFAVVGQKTGLSPKMLTKNFSMFQGYFLRLILPVHSSFYC